MKKVCIVSLLMIFFGISQKANAQSTLPSQVIHGTINGQTINQVILHDLNNYYKLINTHIWVSDGSIPVRTNEAFQVAPYSGNPLPALDGKPMTCAGAKAKYASGTVCGEPTVVVNGEGESRLFCSTNLAKACYTTISTTNIIIHVMPTY